MLHTQPNTLFCPGLAALNSATTPPSALIWEGMTGCCEILEICLRNRASRDPALGQFLDCCATDFQTDDGGASQQTIFNSRIPVSSAEKT